jgi:hypothetical protein
MMVWLRRMAIAVLGRYGARLRFPHLLLLTGALFVVDFFVPDAIPFMDEVFLGLMALLFGVWRRRGDEGVEAGDGDREGDDDGDGERAAQMARAGSGGVESAKRGGTASREGSGAP